MDLVSLMGVAKREPPDGRARRLPRWVEGAERAAGSVGTEGGEEAFILRWTGRPRSPDHGGNDGSGRNEGPVRGGRGRRPGRRGGRTPVKGGIAMALDGPIHGPETAAGVIDNGVIDNGGTASAAARHVAPGSAVPVGLGPASPPPPEFPGSASQG